jgi:AraC family L-rhamnose operon transcriptional activator RhaR
MSWIDILNTHAQRVVMPGCNVDVLHWAYSPNLPDNVLHRHTFFEVCLVGQYGEGCFTVSEQEFFIGPGNVFFARPGVLHRIQNTARPAMELFWVSFAVVPQPGNAPYSSEASTLVQTFAASPLAVANDDGAVFATWNALRVLAQRQPRAGTAMQLEHLKAALLLAIMQSGTQAEEQRPVPLATSSSTCDHSLARLVTRYIHDNLDRHLAIAELADHAHISTRQLTRLMKTFAGTSPAAYVERARMDRARALLRGSDTPIKTIATEVGYPDVHHFTRVFRRNFAVAPGQFRQGDNGRSSVIQQEGDLV